MKTKLLDGFDLILVDADGTVAPHLTVGLANEIAKRAVLKVFCGGYKGKRQILSTSKNIMFTLHYLFTHKLKLSSKLKDYIDMAVILYWGLEFHIIRAINNLFNSLNLPTTNKMLIEGVVRVLKRFDFKNAMYTEEEVEKVLYPGVRKLIRSAKAKKVMVSEDFVVHWKGHLLTGFYKNLLGLDEIVSNEIFVGEKGVSGKIKIKNKHDKRNAAKDVIKRYKAKRVALLCNDFEDVEIANLPQVKLVVANNPPLRLRKIADYVVDNDYRNLI